MIKKLNTSEKNILEYEVQDEFTEEENTMVLREMEKAIEEHGSVKLLVKLKEIPKIEMASIPDRLKFAKEHMEKIEKYAVVTESNLLDNVAKVLNPITDMEVKVYSLDQEEQARAWLR